MADTYNFEELLAASAFVRPYSAELRDLKEKLRGFIRISGDNSKTIGARSVAGAEIDKLEQRGRDLLGRFEAASSIPDPTGKIGQLQLAIEGFLGECAAHHRI